MITSVMQVPGRMWKRYAETNSKFAWLLLKAKLGLFFRLSRK